MRIACSRSGRVYLALGIGVLVILCIPGASLYYEASGGRACARCHEIWQLYADWHTSAHRNIKCTECHGHVFTLDAGFHLNNMRRVFTHLQGDARERVRIRERDIPKIMANCQRCHQQEYADWQAGPHGVSYRDIFLDKTFNQKNILMDDCLRCHGMHFEGSIRELVQPITTTGPWSLRDRSLADHPVIPCLTCHQIHKEGVPLQRSRLGVRASGPEQEIMLPSLALFDRREMESVAVSRLSLLEMKDGNRLVKTSSDPRQALCYQCHAPRATQQVGSGDDRTPTGVHEGLSCLACHLKHGQLTRASCATCHPRLSNCGLDVEKMDTTFRSPKSPHDIHFVKCEDCHAKGVPKKAHREVHFPTSANAPVKPLHSDRLRSSEELSRAKMLSGVNAASVTNIQEEETEVTILRRPECYNLTLRGKRPNGVSTDHMPRPLAHVQNKSTIDVFVDKKTADGNTARSSALAQIRSAR